MPTSCGTPDWAGRPKRLWLWAPMALLCGALGGVLLIGVGLSGILAGRSTRRPGLVVACAGFLWLFCITAIGGSGAGGTILGPSYGYLLGSHTGRVGLLALILGVFGHLGSVVDVLSSRWALAVDFLLPVGIVGILSPWGLGMTLVASIPPMLVGALTFFRPLAAFQVWPAMPFVLVGSVMVVLSLLSTDRVKPGREGLKLLAIALGVVWAVMDVSRVIVDYRVIPETALAVDRAAGLQLVSLSSRIPQRSEVIASDGLVGRFADRRYLFHFDGSDHRFPVRSSSVYFVISPTQGLGQIGSSGSQAVVRYVTQRLNGTLLMDQAGVIELEWHPNPTQTTVVLP